MCMFKIRQTQNISLMIIIIRQYVVEVECVLILIIEMNAELMKKPLIIFKFFKKILK